MVKLPEMFFFSEFDNIIRNMFFNELCLTRFQNGKIPKWQNIKMTKFQNGKMAEETPDYILVQIGVFFNN
jgi:hypothetical protein